MHNVAVKGQPWARMVQIPSPPARGGPAPGRRDGDATPLFAAGRVCGDGRRQGRLREPHSPMIPRCLCTAPRPLKIVLQLPASLHFSPGIVARARRCPWLQGARAKRRAGVLYRTLSTFSERKAVDAGTSPGKDDSWDGGARTASGTAVEDDCRDAGRLQGCRTTAGMQELEQRRSGCRARATQERLPR